MGFVKNWRRRRVLRRSSLQQAEWQRTVADLPVLRGLNLDELRRLKDLTVLFLHEKSLEVVGDLELTDAMRLRIAAQACLPILNLDLDYYRNWVSVIVYPAGFLSHRQYRDTAGVVHSGYQARVGESWAQGPVILSWADIAHTGVGDGFNVVIHEFAHKLDMLNGVANGMPPLHRDMAVAAWSRLFTAAYEDLCSRMEAGLGTIINPYAGESPAEFFAVVSEAFFEIPNVLLAVYPEIYGQLRAFYRQHPVSRQETPLRDTLP